MIDYSHLKAEAQTSLPKCCGELVPSGVSYAGQNEMICCDAWQSGGNVSVSAFDLLELISTVERLEHDIGRIQSFANCGSVQNWLKLSDEDKAKWFYLYCQKDSENVALRRELDDLRESINGMKTQAC